MEEVELILIGAACAGALALCEARFRSIVARIPLNVATLAAIGLALHLLRLTLVGDPMDLLSADFGVILVVGVCGIGGLLPPSVTHQ